MTLSLFTAPVRRALPLAPGANAVIIDHWLSAARAGALFDLLRAEKEWRQETLMLAGRRVAEPRLSIGYGTPYRYSGVQRKSHRMPHILLDLLASVSAETGARFNQALVQLYRDGEDSIAWHADDEEELGANPTIAAVSLGGVRRFTFRSKVAHGSIPIDLTDGSLLVMSGSTQALYEHSIPKVKRAAPRISITFRLVR